MTDALLTTETVEAPKVVPAWDERATQDAVYIYCAIKNHEIIVPNSCLFGWESDVVSVNRTGFIFEFEIKVTRADFRADAKKERAKLLVNPVERSQWYGERTHERPNYFYYAVPEGLISPDELPEYAGLIYVRRRVEGHHLYYGTAAEVKPPRRLHREKIVEWQRNQLARALTGRYWRQRLKSIGASAPRVDEACEGDDAQANTWDTDGSPHVGTS